jgi:4-phytase/acid phosphatase
MIRRLLSLAYLLSLLSVPAIAQLSSASPQDGDAQLQYVVYVSRHGVRSPTGKASQYSIYSRAPWPEWSVAPGYLTPHGFHLMELFGGFDRMQLASENLFHNSGCQDTAALTIYADSDQRTRETGKALAKGLFPGCNVPVQALPEGSNDPLFHPVAAVLSHLDLALATAAVAGRVGGDPANATLAYHQQLASFDNLLATCGAAASPRQKRTSILTVPSTLGVGSGDHLVDLKGPINTASTLSENLLLEYTEGMDPANVGWGCVYRAELEAIMDLHTAASDIAQRTPEIARAQASNLLDHIDRTIKQAITGKIVPGALGKTTDRAIFLVGHDTNLENIAGLLNLNWIIDGRRDDTPPGGALIFEVWRQSKSGSYSVRTYFTAQTLDQMRSAAVLTAANPPERIPVFIPGCSRADYSCTLAAFSGMIEAKIDPRAVITK